MRAFLADNAALSCFDAPLNLDILRGTGLHCGHR